MAMNVPGSEPHVERLLLCGWELLLLPGHVDVRALPLKHNRAS